MPDESDTVLEDRFDPKNLVGEGSGADAEVSTILHTSTLLSSVYPQINIHIYIYEFIRVYIYISFRERLEKRFCTFFTEDFILLK
jgi:hypothetical protein